MQKILQSPWLGGIGSIVVAAWNAVTAVGFPPQWPKDIHWTWVLFVGFAFQAIVTSLLRIRTLEAAQKPQLKMVFYPQRPYIDEYPIAEPTPTVAAAASVSTAVPTATPSDAAPGPNFAGHWMGDLTVIACNAGPFVLVTSMCGDSFAVDSLVPVDLLLTQGPDRISGFVTVSAAYPGWQMDYRGSLVGATDGTHLSGSLTGAGEERNHRTFLVTLRDGGLAGGWTLEFRQGGVAGVGTVVATTAGLTRVP